MVVGLGTPSALSTPCERQIPSDPSRCNSRFSVLYLMGTAKKDPAFAENTHLRPSSVRTQGQHNCLRFKTTPQ